MITRIILAISVLLAEELQHLSSSHAQFINSRTNSLPHIQTSNPEAFTKEVLRPGEKRNSPTGRAVRTLVYSL